MTFNRSRRQHAAAATVTLIAVAAFAVYHFQSPLIAEQSLDFGVLPNSHPFLGPLSYWSDSDHVVCMNQYIYGGNNASWYRHCVVYDVSAERQWRCPAIEQAHYVSPAADFLWESFGLSPDRRNLVILSGHWVTGPAPDVSTQGKAISLQQASYPMELDPGALHAVPAEGERPTASGVRRKGASGPTGGPHADRFAFDFAGDLCAISPNGRLAASVDAADQPDRSSGVGNFMNRWQLIAPRRDYVLKIGERGLFSFHRVTLPEQPYGMEMDDYDIRWSPDGKRLSCLMNYRGNWSRSNRSGESKTVLVVYDVEWLMR